MVKSTGISAVLYKIMICIFLLIIAFAAFSGMVKETFAFVCSAVLAVFLEIFIKKCKGLPDKFSDRRNIIVLSLICFAVKFLWVYFMRIEPQVDYETFYLQAVELSKNWVARNKYVALFPHIMGYSTFLSLFLAIFGESYFVASVLNVLLSVVSGILIYQIVRGFISTPAATAAYIMWIICPSQTMYNNLVLSEPLYTALILAFIYIIVILRKKEENLNWKQMLGYGALSGLVIESVNVSRPIGMILVIAVFIGIFFLRFDEFKNKNFIKKQAAFLSAMLVVYFALGGAWDIYLTARLGEEPAAAPGYNIHVGFNADTAGQWNYEDADLLTSYAYRENMTADCAQNQMLEEAKKRIFSGDINFLELFSKKMNVFLGNDSACVFYNGDIISNKDFSEKICNIFWYFLLILNILGGIKLMKASPKSSVFLMPLFAVGITLAQMLVEVAPRYHYSVVPVFIIISQFYLFEKKEKGNEK